MEFMSNLSRHTKTVNVVRFSPQGKPHSGILISLGSYGTSLDVENFVKG